MTSAAPTVEAVAENTQDALEEALEPALARAARHYAQHYGWPVFPLHSSRDGKCSCKQPDCGNAAKHPRTKRGFLEATTDLERIDAWWARHPDSNVGIPTGALSGVVVVDVDPRNGGDEHLETLLDELGLKLPPTIESLTGGGGRHILFRYPDLKGASLRTTKLCQGVDFKSDGGYIVAPPSVHASGRSYAWEASSRPGDVALAELPAVLLQRVLGPSTKRQERQGAKKASHPAAITAPLRESFFYLAFEAAGMLRGPIDTSRHAVVCPWESEHTTGGGHNDTSTIVFAPEPGRSLGWFFCSHSHCQGRGDNEVKQALPASAIATALQREAELRGGGPKPLPAARPLREPGEDDDAPPPAVTPPATPSPNAWQVHLTREKTGEPKNTYANLTTILRNVYGSRLRYDEMSVCPTLDGRRMSDGDVGKIREEIERTFRMPPTEANVIGAVRQVSEERSFHPVQEYLRALKWDGTQRLHRVTTDILGIIDPLAQRMVTAWFVSAVNRALHPGCKVDHALVLVGPQGYRKSSFFATLGGVWFSDTAMDISSRDGLMQLATSWIYEWPEIENVTSRKQAGEVKAFVTSSTDTFRAPFAKSVEKHPRSSVVVGTTNEAQFLNDPTGARRFWIVSPSKKADLDVLRRDRDQLWAEAHELALSDYQHWLTDEEDVEREKQAEQHQVPDAWQDTVAEWLDGETARKTLAAHGHVTASDILTAMQIPKERWDRVVQMRIGHAMRRLGWDRRRRRASPSAEGTRTVWAFTKAKHGSANVTGEGGESGIDALQRDESPL